MDLVTLLWQERSALQSKAEAALARFGRTLFVWVLVSLVVAANTRGYTDWDRLEDYREATKLYDELLIYKEDKKSEWSNLKSVSGLELSVLDEQRFQTFFKDLEKIAANHILFDGSARVLKIVKRIFNESGTYGTNSRKLAAQLNFALDSNEDWGGLHWDEAKLVKTEPSKEAIRVINGKISNIHERINGFMKVANYGRAEKELKLLIRDIGKDLEAARRQVTEIRIPYQGLQLSLPVLLVLYWYPLSIAVLMLVVRFQYQAVLECTRDAANLSRRLRCEATKSHPANGNPSNESAAAGLIQIEKPRLGPVNWLLMAVIALSNLWIIGQLAFRLPLVNDQTENIFGGEIYNIWVWSFMVLVVLFVCGLMIKSMSSLSRQSRVTD